MVKTIETMKETFKSTNLAFVATAVLTGRATIIDVFFHPTKQFVKVFCLSPKDEAKKVYMAFASDKLTLSPNLLASKIQTIRHIPARVLEKETK